MTITNEKLTPFEQRVEISDINYKLYELEKAEKTMNIIESGTVSYDLAMKAFIKNTIEVLNTMKLLIENSIPKE